MVKTELRRLALATGLASVGLAAGGTGGALLATEIARTEAVAGLPFGAMVAGSAVGALLISMLTLHIGRGRALAAGYGIGVMGAAAVVVAAAIGSLGLLLVGSVLLGPANAAVFLSRYAGADLAAPGGRGSGLGGILFVTAIGAVLAPNLLGPSGAVADALGLSAFAGLYLVAFVAFLAGAGVLARSRPVSAPRSSSGGAALPVPRAGLLVLAAANFAMVGMMAVAPVHLSHHGHDLGFIGLAISLHVALMLGPSPVTGRMADRFGPRPVAAAGALLLLAAGMTGAVADPADALQSAGFLAVLGFGWNLAVVAGSAMLTDALPAAARPRAEAAGEVGMSLAAAAGSVGAGLVAAAAGWGVAVVALASIGAVATGVAAGALQPPYRQEHRHAEAGTAG